MQDLVHRASRLDDPVGGQALAKEVLSCDITVRHIDIACVIDYPPVNFLRDPLVKTPVPGLHMKDRYLSPFGGNNRQAAVGITKDEQGVRPFCLHDLIRKSDNISDRPGDRSPHGIQEMVRLPYAQLLKKDLIQFIVKVLTGVDQDMRKAPIQLAYHAAEFDYLGPRPDNGHYLQWHRQ